MDKREILLTIECREHSLQWENKPPKLRRCIAHCDWLPEQARWSELACSGLPTMSHKKNFPESQLINPLLTKLLRSRWLDIGLVLFFFACLWTLTPSQSINTQKKNLANIQPS